MRIKDARDGGSPKDTPGVGLHKPGDIFEVPEELGKALLKNGLFRKVKEAPPKRVKKEEEK